MPGSKLPSTFSALRRPAFRILWLVWLGANLTMWLSDIASAWLMTSLTDSALMIAMVQSASTLPLFLLGLPSGALADLVDRRRYLALTQVWVGVIAIALAALSYYGWLNAPLLLACTFFNGVGMAMRWPLFAAIVPELVPRGELPAALALNGIAANLSRIIAPMVAGALLASTGGVGVYLLNAGLSVVALALILHWRAPSRVPLLPGERLFSAMRAGLLHVGHSPLLRVILLRIFLFFLQVTALTALLPLVALRLAGAGAGPGAGASAYTALLVALATGGIVIAFCLNWLRRHAGADTIVAAGVCVHALASTCAALAPDLWLAAPAVAVAGMAWLATANSLTVAVQLALPDRVRARGMAIYHMAVMGGSALGAALWGGVASAVSVPASIFAAAALGPLVLLLTRCHGVGGDADGAGKAGDDMRQNRRFID